MVGFRKSRESRFSFWQKLKKPGTYAHNRGLDFVEDHYPGQKMKSFVKFLNLKSPSGAITAGNRITHGHSLARATELFKGTAMMPLINVLLTYSKDSAMSIEDAAIYVRESDPDIEYSAVKETFQIKDLCEDCHNDQMNIVGRSLVNAVPVMLGCPTDPYFFPAVDFFELLQSETWEQTRLFDLLSFGNPGGNQQRINRNMLVLLNPNPDCCLVNLGNEAAHPVWHTSSDEEEDDEEEEEEEKNEEGDEHGEEKKEEEKDEEGDEHSEEEKEEEKDEEGDEHGEEEEKDEEGDERGEEEKKEEKDEKGDEDKEEQNEGHLVRGTNEVYITLGLHVPERPND
ncbi:Protein of unknown function [Pyronema omphalodes CBS 100304]|uniref:Uncharacterized protein n=1 Tax=Pyronema omphalodes (strain CBS 100304) TaxID=1076935 RepID=U4L227_PYROM|nr:Protein of unknown function [Pyronema omphalodes CBS 100304]